MSYRVTCLRIVSFVILIATYSVSANSGQVFAQEELPAIEELAPPQTTDPQPQESEQPGIDPGLAGWNEAGRGAALGSRIRGHWVMVSQTGELTGSVVGNFGNAPGPMDIFALNRGFVKSQTKTDRSGNFRLAGLTQGAYTIVGYSPESFFTYGVQILEFRDGVKNLPRRIISQAIGGNEKQQTCEIIQDHSPSVQFKEFGKFSFDESEIGRATHFGFAGLETFDVESFPATSIQTQTIQLESDGVLRGRIHQIDHLTGRPLPVTQTRVMLVEQGELVAQADCNRLGVFEISGLPSGSFALVATGKDGFAAIGIRVSNGIGSQMSKHSPQPSTSLASSNTRAAARGGYLDLSLVQPESVGWINHYVGEHQFAEALAQPRFRSDQIPCCNLCHLPLIQPGACDCGR